MDGYPVLDRLKEYMGLTGEERELYPFQFPRLFDTHLEERLPMVLAGVPVDLQNALESACQELVDRRNRLIKGSIPYRIGHGPIEKLSARLASGEISFDTARQLASAQEVAGEISELYAGVLSKHTNQQAHKGNWEQVIVLQRLLLAAALHMPEYPEAETVRKYVVLDLIEVVKEMLVSRPDGRYYREALQAGEAMLTEHRDRGDRFYLGRLTFRLGTLHLDPYERNLSDPLNSAQIDIWHQALNQVTDSSGVAALAANLPAPAAAFQIAEKYLRQSVEFSEGDLKGRSLKALAQAMVSQAATGLPLRDAEIQEACKQALQLLDPQTSVEYRVATEAMLEEAVRRQTNLASPPNSILGKIRAMLQNMAQKKPMQNQPASTAPDELFNAPMEEIIQTYPAEILPDIILQTVRLHMRSEPERCLERLIEARSYFEGLETVQLRKMRLEEMIDAFRTLAQPDLPEIRTFVELKRLIERLYRRGMKEGWSEHRLAAALITLATYTSKFNQETIGLNLINELAEVYKPTYIRRINDVLNYIFSQLQVGEGANRFNAGDYPSAAERYWNALFGFGELGFPQDVIEMLRRILETLRKIGSDIFAGKHAIQSHGMDSLRLENILNPSQLAIQHLAMVSFKLDELLGDAAVEWIQKICAAAFLAMDRESIDVEHLHRAIQIAKGLRLQVALRGQTHYRMEQDAEALDLLKKVQVAERALDRPLFDYSLEQSEFKRNMLLSTALVRGIRLPGDDAGERLENLQRSFDQHVNRAIFTVKEIGWNEMLSTSDVQAALDEHTVLLNYYHLQPIGEWFTETYTIVFVITREKVQIGLLEHPASFNSLNVDNIADIGPMEIMVSHLRDLLFEEPGPWPVSSDAARMLVSYQDELLGKLDDVLENYRIAGKNHLCIVPHGPYNYLPFHLLGEVGDALADRWIVTYLPNLGLIDRIAPRPSASGLSPIAAVGLSFTGENPFNLPPIENAPGEAEQIAGVFDCAPLLEEKATPSAVLQALEGARYAHIASHGLHNLSGASFQCIFLAPEPNDDGRLFAYEVLGADMNHLEVLTLSACETALGRFDPAGNLQGLPVAFLLTGVRTIIGTLWPVATEPAETFFTTFYREIHQETPLLNAFATAQRETKRAYPQYIDWGAFYLIGGW